jgi:CheY-like chemotaxis protein
MAKTKLTILLFDNEPILDELYKNVFEEAGHNFIVTTNINEAVRLCREGNISLVLSDMILRTDHQTNESLGFVLLRTVKILLKTTSIPFVIFTNLTQMEDRRKASKFGADDFWDKSDYTPKELVKKVEKLIKK